MINRSTALHVGVVEEKEDGCCALVCIDGGRGETTEIVCWLSMAMAMAMGGLQVVEDARKMQSRERGCRQG